MARRPGTVRPPSPLGKAPPRITAPFAISWRQVLALWVVGGLIVVGACWRWAPKETARAGQEAWQFSKVAWAYSLLYANRYWPGWLPMALPRPHRWPGYDRQLPWPGSKPMAKPKPQPARGPDAKSQKP